MTFGVLVPRLPTELQGQAGRSPWDDGISYDVSKHWFLPHRKKLEFRNFSCFSKLVFCNFSFNLILLVHRQKLYRDIVCADMEETSVSRYHVKYHLSIASSRLDLVAQLVERRTSKPKVVCSNPSRGRLEFSLLARYGFESLGSSINISLYIFIKFIRETQKKIIRVSDLYI